MVRVTSMMAEKQWNYRVTFHDIPNHFIGINKIVYSNKIITNSKFIIEEVFTDSVENDQKNV